MSANDSAPRRLVEGRRDTAVLLLLAAFVAVEVAWLATLAYALHRALT